MWESQTYFPSIPPVKTQDLAHLMAGALGSDKQPRKKHRIIDMGEALGILVLVAFSDVQYSIPCVSSRISQASKEHCLILNCCRC